MKIRLIIYVAMVYPKNKFRSDVSRAYNNCVDVSVPSKPEEVPTAVTDGIAYIEGYNVNLRKDKIRAIQLFVS